MWDATAKSTEGILRGSIFQMGDFHECLSTKAPFSTQYCFATVSAQVPHVHRSSDPIALYRDPHGTVLRKVYVSIFPHTVFLILFRRKVLLNYGIMIIS